MATARLHADVHDESQKPVVLIGGDTQFIGYYLRQLLVQQDCRVIFLNDPADAKIESIDYVFCLAAEKEEEIKELIKIAEKFNARFLLALTDDVDVNKEVESFLLAKKVDWRILQLGYVYGPRMSDERYQEALQLIKVVKIQPVFISDAIYVLIKAMFTSGTSGRKLALTDHSFSKEVTVGLKEGLKQTEEFFSKRKGEKREEKIEIVQKEKKKKKRRNLFLTIIGSKKLPLIAAVFLIVSLLSYPFVSLALNIFLGTRGLKKTQEASLKADFSGAVKHAQRARASFSRSKEGVNQLAFLFNFFGQERIISRAEKAFDLGEKIALGLGYAAQGAEKASELGMIIFQGKEGGVENLTAEVKQDLDAAYQQLSFVEGTLRSEPTLLEVGKILGLNYSSEVLVKKIPELKELMMKTNKGIQLMPELVGLYRKQTYLVLFQNNMELRPTGGFIGSFALLTFDKGQLLDFEVRDVYSADGQLKGHVEPPPELKEHLGEANWYLRDSNWDPDFPTSAARAAWFLEKETGRTVDGVIGINLFFAQKLLEVTGEVNLPDYQEKINAANLFERAEYHSEVNFFPGSTQKQEFLGSLARVLFETIKTSDAKGWLRFSQGIYQSLKEKDVLIYLSNQEATEIMADLGWEGGVRSLNCTLEETGCLVDYLMIVDANLGINKANYFVKRNFSHQVRIQADGTVEATASLHYKNESQSEVFPAGKYKDYLRFLTPLGTELLGVKLDQEELAQEKINQSVLHEKQMFGFLLEVPIQEERTVEITYRLANKIPPGEKLRYLLLLQKQSGLKDEEFNFWFTSPEDASIVTVEPDASFTKRAVIFTPEFSQDLVFEIQLVR